VLRVMLVAIRFIDRHQPLGIEVRRAKADLSLLTRACTASSCRSEAAWLVWSLYLFAPRCPRSRRWRSLNQRPPKNLCRGGQRESRHAEKSAGDVASRADRTAQDRGTANALWAAIRAPRRHPAYPGGWRCALFGEAAGLLCLNSGPAWGKRFWDIHRTDRWRAFGTRSADPQTGLLELRVTFVRFPQTT
jgi:hypothetical protein